MSSERLQQHRPPTPDAVAWTGGVSALASAGRGAVNLAKMAGKQFSDGKSFMNKFYRILVDPNATARWYLKAPVDQQGREIDARLFTRGVPFGSSSPLCVPLRRQGEEVDINFADFDMLVVSRKIIDGIASDFDLEVQRIPAEISGRIDYEIVNPLASISCIDEGESDYIKWTGNDGRPEKTGQFRMVTKLKIKKNLPTESHLFRVAEWPVALLVSEALKESIERRHASGVMFSAV